MKKSNVKQVLGAYLISVGPSRSQGGPCPAAPPPPPRGYMPACG